TVASLPIVLAHGFDGSTTNRWSFNGVADALRAAGFTVHEAKVAPYRTPAVRALELKDHVDQAMKEADTDRVHIIAHSMGGIAARERISGLGYAPHVASLTTVGTPHWGTPIADLALKILPENRVANDALNAIASAWALTFTDPDLAGADVRNTLAAISTESMA